MTEHEKLKNAVTSMLEAMGENPNRDGLIKTPERVAKAWREMLAGYDEDPVDHLTTSFSLEGTKPYDQIILSRDIPFMSFCEHHLMPFRGFAHVAYIPQENSRVVGLSKLARVVDGYAKRLQVQERLTQQIAEALLTLKPFGAAVIIKAQHTCQHDRGVKKDGWMVTSSLHGAFKDNPDARLELLDLIKL